jgi:hypothetical protein
VTSQETTMKTIRIGAGAGYSGDRVEPALELAEKGHLDYLVFECLAERTIALAQQDKQRDPAAGFDPLLIARFEAVLPACIGNRVRIITNMGAANPEAAAEAVARVARRLGLRLTIGVVTGDDVRDAVIAGDARLEELGSHVSTSGRSILSANAYLGAEGIINALGYGADVVITGRTADPSLFLAPMVHEFGWALDDWPRLGRGTSIGHLLECAGQVTGGYFADPGVKDVPDLARLGFPLAEVDVDGGAVLTKVDGSGGRVTTATCKEQLLYELHRPDRYMTPDVVADFTGVRFRELAPNRIDVRGASGAARPERLKVSVGYQDGFIGEGQISYAGPGAVARARLAIEIVNARLALRRIEPDEIRCDCIGLDAILGGSRPGGTDPPEVRVRVAARCRTAEMAAAVAHEVETLYTNGPAAGGGVTKLVRAVLAMDSTSLPRAAAVASVKCLEVVP